MVCAGVSVTFSARPHRIARNAGRFYSTRDLSVCSSRSGVLSR